MSAATVEVTARPRDSRLFLSAAVVMLAIVLVAFAPTLYLRAPFGSLDYATGSRGLPGHLLVHGMLLTAWFALLVVQAWLVAARRTAVHRRLGVLGAALAAALVASSWVALTRFAARLQTLFETTGAAGRTAEGQALEFAAPIVLADSAALLLFVCFVGMGVYRRANGATHKRLMLLASLTIVGPAFSDFRPVGKALALLLPPGAGLPVFVVVTLGALAWHDYRSRRRLDPATGWGALALLTAFAVAPALLGTSAAADYVRWVSGFAR